MVGVPRLIRSILFTWEFLFISGFAQAATLPVGFQETLLASGLSRPTAMAFAPDGRLFVCEQGGAVRVIKNGSLLATPFHTLTVSSIGERGLLGIAFDPNFQTNRFIYLYYTATSPAIHNRLSRFTANGDVVVPASELVLLDLETLSATNHNGGAIHFGADGKLYVATGENAVSSNAQSMTSRLGKILRINSNGTIPTDNPFFTTATGVYRFDLGARAAQSVYLRGSPYRWNAFHQRRRRTVVGGNQPGGRWGELRVADDRRTYHRSAVPEPLVCVRPFRWLCHRRRRLP